METSKHQQLFLAEDHPVPAATRWTARSPVKTQGLESDLVISDVCKMLLTDREQKSTTAHTDLFYMIKLGFNNRSS